MLLLDVVMTPQPFSVHLLHLLLPGAHSLWTVGEDPWALLPCCPPAVPTLRLGCLTPPVLFSSEKLPLPPILCIAHPASPLARVPSPWGRFNGCPADRPLPPLGPHTIYLSTQHATWSRHGHDTMT